MKHVRALALAMMGAACVLGFACSNVQAPKVTPRPVPVDASPLPRDAAPETEASLDAASDVVDAASLAQAAYEAAADYAAQRVANRCRHRPHAMENLRARSNLHAANFASLGKARRK